MTTTPRRSRAHTDEPAPPTPVLAEPGEGADSLAARTLPVLAAGIVLGIIEVVIATSFAVLIFAGPLSVHVPAAIGVSLVAAIVVLTVTALLSSVPGTVGSVQDVSAAVLALIAAAIVARLGPDAPETFLTVVLALGLTTLLAGVFFLLLGSLRLGDLIRFVPYPVVGGFLGGTGWLLVQGSVGVLADTPLRLSTLPALFEPGSLARWVPGAVIALVLLAVIRRYGHFLSIPAVLATVVVAFYAVLAVAGVSLAQAEAHGWLLGPFPDGGLWQPWFAQAVTGGSWSTVALELGNVATLIVFAALGLLLNAGGIELVLERDADLDRELRTAGAANIVAGLAGGIPGYQAMSLTALAHRMRATSRLVGLVAAGVCALALVFGADALSLFPRMAVGGLLLFVGLSFLIEWVYEPWSKLPRGEYAVLVVIVVLIGAWGFLQGVAVGLGAAVALFLVNYSRLDVVKHALSGTTYQSRVDRPDEHRATLTEHGEQLHILELKGFLFFGTANRLFERIRGRTQAPDVPPLRFLVLDFRRVTGLDSSAVMSFMKTCTLAEAEGFTVVLTDLNGLCTRVLTQGGLTEEEQPALRLSSDLDHGVQWCEEQLLGALVHAQPDTPRRVADWLCDGRGHALLPYLERLEVPAGTTLIRQGDVSDELYFIESGSLTVELTRHDAPPVRLRTVGAGTVIGELTLYLDVPRTATVVSETACTVYRMSADALGSLADQEPALAAALHKWLAGVIARRLANSVRTIQALLD